MVSHFLKNFNNGEYDVVLENLAVRAFWFTIGCSVTYLLVGVL